MLKQRSLFPLMIPALPFSPLQRTKTVARWDVVDPLTQPPENRLLLSCSHIYIFKLNHLWCSGVWSRVMVALNRAFVVSLVWQSLCSSRFCVRVVRRQQCPTSVNSHPVYFSSPLLFFFLLRQTYRKLFLFVAAASLVHNGYRWG